MSGALGESGFFPTTRITLIGRLRDSAGTDWDEFFRIYGPLVHRIASCCGLRSHEADDVVSSVMRAFVQSVKGGFQLDPKRGKFRHYLKTITRREVANVHRRRARSSGPDESAAEHMPGDAPTPDQRWADLEREERMRACLDRLRASTSVRPRDVLAFEHYALRGEPAEQVARLFSIPVDHVYTIKHRVLQRLRVIYHELELELGEV